MAFQFLLLNKFISRSKATVFTWENIFIKHRFPKNLIERFLLDNADFIIVGNSDGKSILEKKGYKGGL